MIKVEIVADSISPVNKRITTFLLTYPRIIHSERLRHRNLSASAQSSRARKPEKILEEIKNNPYIPNHWGKNQKGMQAYEELGLYEQATAKSLILELRDRTLEIVDKLNKIGCHKQIVNRYLEPFCSITEVVTGTDWGNFFNLRVDKAAEPNIMELAKQMMIKYCDNIPKKLRFGEWHLPFADKYDNLSIEQRIKISFARCARASYVNFHGKDDIEDDFRLYNDLVPAYHLSPAEHQAECMEPTDNWDRSIFWWKTDEPKINFAKNLCYEDYDWLYKREENIKVGEYKYYWANFDGWRSHRCNIPNENRCYFNKDELLEKLLK